MNDSNSKNIARDRLDHFGSVLWEFRMMIIVPTVICTVLAVGYSLLKSNTWTAHQSLVIRDDLTGQSYRPGRFESFDSLKLAQETILEIARKPQVIRNAFQQLGPPPSMLTGKASWPSEKTIEETQGRITITAPNGAEFGKTEVILLNVKESSRERSRRFIELMLDEVDQKLNEVRSLKVESMVVELSQAVKSAQVSLDGSSRELQEMDVQFGADLSTLRGLNLQQTGDGSLQQTLVEIRKEQRVAGEKSDLAIKQRELLIKVLEEPQQFLVTSSELLRMQPRLNQLVAGLSTAELDLATKRGKYTDKHVDVISAKSRIRDIRLQILKEIQAAIYGLGIQAENGQIQVAKLKDREAQLERRLSGLSSARVEYDKLEKEVRKKTDVLGQAREELAQIQSVGTSSINLLTRIGEPQVATRPNGPGKRAIVGFGAIGGLFLGLGLVMFSAPPYEGRDQITVRHSPPTLDPSTQTTNQSISWRTPPKGFSPVVPTGTPSFSTPQTTAQDRVQPSTSVKKQDPTIEDTKVSATIPKVDVPTATGPVEKVATGKEPTKPDTFVVPEPISEPMLKTETIPPKIDPVPEPKPVSIDIADVQTRRRENIRPIDLTRPLKTDLTEPQIPKKREVPVTPRSEDRPAQVPVKSIELSPPPAKTDVKSTDSKLADGETAVSKKPDTRNSGGESSAEEIVKAIRAQQIAAAKVSTEKMPIIKNPVAERVADSVDSTDSTDSKKSKQARSQLDSNSLDPPARNSSAGKPEIQDILEKVKASMRNRPPVDRPKDSKTSAPAPDQIRQIQDSISTFCEPLKKKKSDEPKGKPDF